MNLNANAQEIALDMEKKAKELGIRVLELEGGTTVLDCGVEATGSLEAGRLFAALCLGGLAAVTITEKDYDGLSLSSIDVETGDPAIACIASQKAGWKVKVGDFFALGSGPARVLAGKPGHGYTEDSDVAVLALECSKLPDATVAGYVADECGIETENLILLAARTASLAGSTQVSARMVETALFKMEHLGIDVDVVHAAGTSPIAPIIGDDTEMMGVENDMIIYGSEVHLKVNGDVDVNRIPSSSASEYGRPFLDIFKGAGYDFYKIDPGLFSPAEITVENVLTGEVKSAGKINPGMLKQALGGR